MCLHDSCFKAGWTFFVMLQRIIVAALAAHRNVVILHASIRRRFSARWAIEARCRPPRDASRPSLPLFRSWGSTSPAS
ncbi:hypothetical protein F4777DRAFT_534075 [Nemania sp. FL0916]|nr:hypothetical protein F4777DRAFT_534075 [Nemania sp. FL0916]